MSSLLADLAKLPPICTGPHEFQAHDHRHVAAERKDRRCSGRHYCRTCRRWYDGQLCGTGPRPFGSIPDPVR